MIREGGVRDVNSEIEVGGREDVERGRIVEKLVGEKVVVVVVVVGGEYRIY